MTELSQHIGKLLLEHSCVIIPRFGGFVTQYIPAHKMADEQLFLPPIRTVGFNPRLTMNDGILIQSYMQVHHLTFQQSLKLIEKEVEELKQTLHETGTVEVGNIGKFLQGPDEHLNFTPIPSGIISPSLYGLDSFTLEPSRLQQSKSVPEKNPESNTNLPTVFTEQKSVYTITINREFINYAAAIIIALFSYFIWTTPIGEKHSTTQRSAILQNEFIFSIPKAHKEIVKSDTTTIPTAHIKTNTKTEEINKDSISTYTSQTKDFFTIVLASRVTHHNATAYVNALHSKGLKDAEVLKAKTTRVIYGHFATEHEAYQQLQRLRNLQDINEPWVMLIK